MFKFYDYLASDLVGMRKSSIFHDMIQDDRVWVVIDVTWIWDHTMDKNGDTVYFDYI